MATGNHFWLDVVAGVARRRDRAALLVYRTVRAPSDAAPLAAQTAVCRRAQAARKEAASVPRVTERPRSPGSSRATPTGRAGSPSRWIGGLARTRVTPNALTAAGVTLCAAAAVLVWFGDQRPVAPLLARGASSSSSARCSTSSTARSPATAARRRRSAPSSTRSPTASARASCSTRSRSSSRARATRSRSRSRSPRWPARSSSPTRAQRRSCSG